LFFLTVPYISTRKDNKELFRLILCESRCKSTCKLFLCSYI